MKNIFLNMKTHFLAALLAGSALLVNGQTADLPQYNPNSVNPIPRYEQLYRIRVWREIDLREKQNEGFFSKNGEISKLLIDAVKSGEIGQVYANDSLTTLMSKSDFYQLLIQSQGTAYPAWDPTMNYITQSDIVSFNGKNYEAQTDNIGKNPEKSPNDWAITAAGRASTYLYSDMTKMRIMEDVIFDRRRSRLYYDVQAIQLVVPGKSTATGVDNELGWIRYKDAERVFRNHPREAVWFNRYNTAENKNFADAFVLRLFHPVIYKVENPDDSSISDIYRENGRPYKEGVWARQWEEIRLMEKEHNLWEY